MVLKFDPVFLFCFIPTSFLLYILWGLLMGDIFWCSTSVVDTLCESYFASSLALALDLANKKKTSVAVAVLGFHCDG